MQYIFTYSIYYLMQYTEFYLPQTNEHFERLELNYGPVMPNGDINMGQHQLRQ